MKHFYYLLLVLLSSSACLAQKKVKPTDEKPPKVGSQRFPLPDDAFDQMIIQDITYAVAGESTPTSGIKIDIAKPDITITAVAPNASEFKILGFKPGFDIFSFDFKAGAADRNISLIRGFNNFNTGLEFRPNFHWIPAKSSAKYGTAEETTTDVMLINAKNKLADEFKILSNDSAEVIKIIHDYYLYPLTNPAGSGYTFPVSTLIPQQISIAKALTIKYTKNDTLTFNTDASIQEIVNHITQISITNGPDKYINPKSYNDPIIKDYNRIIKSLKNIDKTVLSKKIKNASEIWTSKYYVWYTLSFSLRADKIEERYTQFEGRDSSYIKSDYKPTGGATFYFNHYWLYPDRFAHLLRYGFGLSYSSNISNLSSFNYENKNSLFAYGTNVTERVKTGTAYNHSDINRGPLLQGNFEYYYLPLKSLSPGFYFSTNANISKIYNLQNTKGRGNDFLQIPIETGAVFNVNSREKDKEKSILSLLVYFRYEDLTDRRRTPLVGKVESRDDFRKRNLGLGLRIGIPITLPQRNN